MPYTTISQKWMSFQEYSPTSDNVVKGSAKNLGSRSITFSFRFLRKISVWRIKELLAQSIKFRKDLGSPVCINGLQLFIKCTGSIV